MSDSTPPPYNTPGTPGYGGQEGVGPAPAGEATAPVKKKSNPLLRFGIPIVVLLVVIAAGWFFSRDNVSSAKAGDCLPASAMTESFTDASKIKKTDCTAADAAYKVTGIVDGKTFEEAKAEDCAAYASTDNGLWLGEKGKKGKIFCLQTLKK